MYSGIAASIPRVSTRRWIIPIFGKWRCRGREATMSKQWQCMQDRVTAYLHYRRQLGYRLAIEGAQLERFAEFADRRGHHGPLTLAIMLAWAGASRTQFGPARRLEIVRPFA